MRETTIAPPMPAARPLKVKAATFIARVLMPDSRAASGLPPTAYSQRPNFVRERTKPQAKAATMRIQIEYFTPNSSLVPSAKKPWSLTVTRKPLVITLLRPATIRLVASVQTKELMRA